MPAPIPAVSTGPPPSLFAQCLPCLPGPTQCLTCPPGFPRCHWSWPNCWPRSPVLSGVMRSGGRPTAMAADGRERWEARWVGEMPGRAEQAWAGAGQGQAGMGRHWGAGRQGKQARCWPGEGDWRCLTPGNTKCPDVGHNQTLTIVVCIFPNRYSKH